MKLIIANGCSMASGFECTAPGTQHADDWNYAWPAKIAEHYNIDHINLSRTGQSNWSISVTTQSEVLRLLNHTSAENILVIIGWTEFTRSEYITDKECINLNAGLLEYYNKGLPKSLYHLKADIAAGIAGWVGQSIDSHMNKFIWTYWGLIQFLKNYKIKYFFFNALNKPYHPNNDLLFLNTKINKHYSPDPEVWNTLHTDPYYDSGPTQFDWLKTYYPDHTVGEGVGQKHWNSEALAAWAQYLIPSIDKQFL
jgi:hypothetical protein